MKVIDIQVKEEQRIPNKMDAKRPTRRHIIIKIPKVNDTERISKAEREKQLVTYRGVPIRLSTDFSKESLQEKKGPARNIQSHEKQGPTAKITLPSKAII